MIYEPMQKNKAPNFTVLALFAAAAVTIGFSQINNIAGKGILQTLALVFFGLMIYALVRFRFTRVRYEIRLRRGADADKDAETVDELDGQNISIKSYPPKKLEFAVHKSQSSGRFITECVISLAELRSCSRLPAGRREKKLAMKAYGAMPTFKYVKNMVGAEEWLLTARVDSGLVKIVIEPGDELADYLCAVAGYNKELRDAAKNADL